MVAFSVCRVGRLSGASEVSAAFGHNLRTSFTPNADPNGAVMTLRSFNDPAFSWNAPTPWDAVQNRIHEAETSRKESGHKIRNQRKDAVHAIEMVLSASPEYFRPDSPKKAGYWHDDRLEAWRERTWNWLQKRYGDCLIDARLHLDEATPHIQAILVPITSDNRLSAKELFSGRTIMSELQTDYAQAISSTRY